MANIVDVITNIYGDEKTQLQKGKFRHLRLFKP